MFKQMPVVLFTPAAKHSNSNKQHYFRLSTHSLSVILILSLSVCEFVQANASTHCLDRIDSSASSASLSSLTSSSASSSSSSSPSNTTNRSIANLCKCPPDKPVRLSPEIPCQRLKALGEVCLHSSECDGPHSACVAALLYPVELHAVPNYRSWYIYNQITGSDDLNYLLNKVYGQCRCRAGFRSSSNRTCVPRDRSQTSFNCSSEEFPDPCTSLVQHSRCISGFCECERGRLFNTTSERCYSTAASYYGQFCVTSGDCQSSNDGDHQLHCSKGKCSCSLGFRYSYNASACVSLRRCDLGFFWNRTTARCEPLSEMSLFYNSLLLKIFLLLLVNLFVLNLIRYACYARFFQAREVALPFRDDDDLDLESSVRNRHSRHHHRSSRSGHHSQLCRNGRCAQSQSLLSLPPYDLLYNAGTTPGAGRDANDNDEPSTPTSTSSLAPPTYDEAMRAKALDDEPLHVDNGLSMMTMTTPPPPPTTTPPVNTNSVLCNTNYSILKDNDDDDVITVGTGDVVRNGNEASDRHVVVTVTPPVAVSTPAAVDAHISRNEDVSSTTGAPQDAQQLLDQRK